MEKKARNLDDFSKKKTEEVDQQKRVFKTGAMNITSVNLPQKNFIILGKTGVGKTFLLNTCYNHALEIPYDKEKEYIIEVDNHKCTVRYEANSVSEQTEMKTGSHTKICSVKKFLNKKKDTEFNFMDTPGLGDTLGVEQDKKNIIDIWSNMKLLAQLNGILIVSRVLDTLEDGLFKYYIGEILTLLPKECKEHIIIVLTWDSGLDDPTEALDSFEKIGLPIDKYVKFDNRVIANDITTGDLAKPSWESSRASFHKLVDLLASKKAMTSKIILNFAKERQSFKDNLDKMVSLKLEMIDRLEEKKNLEKSMEFYKEQEKANEVYEEPVEETKYVIDESGKKSLKCMACKGICHQNCNLTWATTKKGDPNLKQCLLLQSGVCVKCNCPLEEHQLCNLQYKQEVTASKKFKTNFTKKALKEEATTMLKSEKEKLDKIEAEIPALKKKLEEAEPTMRKEFKKFKLKALRTFNPAFQGYIQAQIDAEKGKAFTTEKDKKESEILIRKLELEKKRSLIELEIIKEMEKAP